jgi:hypothetical protein
MIWHVNLWGRAGAKIGVSQKIKIYWVYLDFRSHAEKCLSSQQQQQQPRVWLSREISSEIWFNDTPATQSPLLCWNLHFMIFKYLFAKASQTSTLLHIAPPIQNYLHTT